MREDEHLLSYCLGLVDILLHHPPIDEGPIYHQMAAKFEDFGDSKFLSEFPSLVLKVAEVLFTAQEYKSRGKKLLLEICGNLRTDKKDSGREGVGRDLEEVRFHIFRSAFKVSGANVEKICSIMHVSNSCSEGEEKKLRVLIQGLKSEGIMSPTLLDTPLNYESILKFVWLLCAWNGVVSVYTSPCTFIRTKYLKDLGYDTDFFQSRFGSPLPMGIDGYNNTNDSLWFCMETGTVIPSQLAKYASYYSPVLKLISFRIASLGAAIVSSIGFKQDVVLRVLKNHKSGRPSGYLSLESFSYIKGAGKKLKDEKLKIAADDRNTFFFFILQKRLELKENGDIVISPELEELLQPREDPKSEPPTSVPSSVSSSAPVPETQLPAPSSPSPTTLPPTSEPELPVPETVDSSLPCSSPATSSPTSGPMLPVPETVPQVQDQQHQLPEPTVQEPETDENQEVEEDHFELAILQLRKQRQKERDLQKQTEQRNQDRIVELEQQLSRRLLELQQWEQQQQQTQRSQLQELKQNLDLQLENMEKRIQAQKLEYQTSLELLEQQNEKLKDQILRYGRKLLSYEEALASRQDLDQKCKNLEEITKKLESRILELESSKNQGLNNKSSSPTLQEVSTKDKPLVSSLRFSVWKKYYTGVDEYCLICKSEISINNWHAGHVISKANGGDDTLENLVPICMQCNLSMGRNNMNEWVKENFPSRYRAIFGGTKWE